MHLHAKDLKECLRGVEDEEDPEKGAGLEGAGYRWFLLVRLIQEVWRTGHILLQLRWVIVILIPKGGGDYQGVGLLEPIWKVIELILDR